MALLASAIFVVFFFSFFLGGEGGGLIWRLEQGGILNGLVKNIIILYLHIFTAENYVVL